MEMPVKNGGQSLRSRLPQFSGKDVCDAEASIAAAADDAGGTLGYAAAFLIEYRSAHEHQANSYRQHCLSGSRVWSRERRDHAINCIA